jgi:hypothetical protein
VIAAVALILLPFLAASGLWFLRSGRLRARIDLAVCTATLLLAALLPAVAETVLAPLSADEASVLVVLLVAVTAALRRWRRLRQPGRSAPRRAAELAGVGGLLLAALAGHPLLLWAALMIVAAAAAYPALPGGQDRVALLAGGLSLALFGLVIWSTEPSLLAGGCMMVGIGAVTMLSGDAPILLLLLLLRLRALALGLPLTSAALETLLLVLGLFLLLACAALLLTVPSARARIILLVLGQASIGAFAFGLGSSEAVFAGCIHLVLLALTQIAAELSPPGGGIAAPAGLAGLPPFGVSPALMLILLATSDRAIWLLPPLCIGIAAMAWTVIASLPPPRWARPRPGANWVPLATVAVLGFAMPQPLATWLHLLTGVAR